MAPFIGLPGLSFFFGGQPAPPPPPVVFVPEPVYAYPPPPIVVAPPQAPAPSPPPQQVIDPLTEPLARLKSLHGGSRRDGCLEIGSMKDPRAVPSLVERLEHDFDKEVRVAAAWALGEIGDPRASVPLERAAQFDKRQDVRSAAKTAYGRLARPGQPSADPAASSPTDFRAQPAPIVSRPEVYDQGPVPRPVPSDFPPPPPVPASGPNLDAPRS